MKIGKLGGVAALGAALALAAAAPAAAHHNEVDVDLTVDGCMLSASSSWASDEHVVESAAVVVLADGEIHAEPVGDPFEVALPAGTTTVEYRVWGGGERDYDSPALTDLDALLEHLDDGKGELDVDAPGVAWHGLPVEGCEPEATPSPTTGPSGEPSSSPTAEPGDESPAPGAGGELAQTGMPTGLLAGGAVALLGLGSGVAWLARRRRVSFTA